VEVVAEVVKVEVVEVVKVEVVGEVDPYCII
jgi:hypothetical protein